MYNSITFHWLLTLPSLFKITIDIYLAIHGYKPQVTLEILWHCDLWGLQVLWRKKNIHRSKSFKAHPVFIHLLFKKKSQVVRPHRVFSKLTCKWQVWEEKWPTSDTVILAPPSNLCVYFQQKSVLTAVLVSFTGEMRTLLVEAPLPWNTWIHWRDMLPVGNCFDLQV